MRRSEIIEGVHQIIEAIVESKINSRLRTLIVREKPPEAVNLVAASIQYYFSKSQSFNPSAKHLVKILGLDALEDSSFWVKAFSNDVQNDTRPYINKVYTNLIFAREHLPKILELLSRDFLNSSQNNGEPIISNGKEMKLLSVTVFENDNKLSSPQRLVNVLESVNTFYEVCAYLHDESPDTLSVAACDSGSDKAFDFLGVAKLIECVTQLIENMWDRVVYYRERKFEARLDLINKSLPIYEKLDELEKTQPELAQRLRRNVADGVNKFIESGATIPAIDAHSTYNSRSLLSPVQKLLVSAPEDAEELNHPNIASEPPVFGTQSPDQPEMKINNLSPDEKRQFAELLKKIQESSTIQAESNEDNNNPLEV